MTDPKAASLWQAFAAGGTDAYAESARELITLRPLAVVRPDILEIMIANNLVDAKRTSQLDEDLEAEFAALGGTFEKAFVADPYNPARYRDYSNYLLVSAPGQMRQYLAPLVSFFVMDLARVLPDRHVPSIVASTTELEEEIARDFPVLFPEF